MFWLKNGLIYAMGDSLDKIDVRDTNGQLISTIDSNGKWFFSALYINPFVLLGCGDFILKVNANH